MALWVPQGKLWHPDFAVPGRKPVGPVEIDWSHPLTRGLLSFWLFQNADSHDGANSTEQPFWIHDYARECRVNVGSRYPIYLTRAYDGRGAYLHTTNNNGQIRPLAGSALWGSYGWSSVIDTQAYSWFGSGPLLQTTSWHVATGSNTDTYQFYSTSFSASSQVIRCINDALWTAAVDETFSESLTIGQELFWGVTFDGSRDYRGCYFNTALAERYTFTGTINNTTNPAGILGTANSDPTGMGYRWFGCWNRALTPAEAWSLKANPYQFLKPVNDPVFIVSAGTGATTIYPDGKATDEAFGSFTLTPGQATISVSGHDTEEAFGSFTITAGAGQQTALPDGLDTQEAFGSFTITAGAATILVTGFDTEEDFGSPTLSLAAGTPTLYDATAINITYATVTPRVSVDYP